MKLSKVKYYICKIVQKFITHSPETVSRYYRSGGVSVGNNVIICDYIPMTEPELVEIKDDVIVSSEVAFITHDHSINKVTDKGSNLFGKIVIGNNCFIGQRSILMYGIELSDNIIVGSGSVVTSSFREENIIIAGNPAKKIGQWDDFRNKYENNASFKHELETIIRNNSDKLVKK